jgi:hypothetical protein
MIDVCLPFDWRFDRFAVKCEVWSLILNLSYPSTQERFRIDNADGCEVRS